MELERFITLKNSVEEVDFNPSSTELYLLNNVFLILIVIFLRKFNG